MPQVSPNQTNHGRRDATFRGTRADPFAQLPAIEKANRRRKRRLLSDAVRLAGQEDLWKAARALVAVKHRWARIGSAGVEYDSELDRRLERVLADFRTRYAKHTTTRTPTETYRRTAR